MKSNPDASIIPVKQTHYYKIKNLYQLLTII